MRDRGPSYDDHFIVIVLGVQLGHHTQIQAVGCPLGSDAFGVLLTVMAPAPRARVCDVRGRVFGPFKMRICDGSVLSANLGVNPSLTIAALTEHAMSQIPEAAHQTWTAEAGQP